MTAAGAPRILLLLLRRDLRLADNPLFHALRNTKNQHTHVLPVYILNPQQMEVSGLLLPGTKSPYEEARSRVGGFWRCGPHRAKFVAECVWDLKEGLKKLGSDLVMRVGWGGEVVGGILEEINKTEGGKVVGVWMTRDYGSEEMSEERGIKDWVEKIGKGDIEFRVFEDESYLIHRDDLTTKPKEVPDVFTQFRKTLEPLRDNIREPHPPPTSIAPLPNYIPTQKQPFEIPNTLDGLITALFKPLQDLGLPGPPLTTPPGAKTAHPFKGGETAGLQRINHMLSSGAMTTYKDTRNGLLGEDFSCRFAAWFAQGCFSAKTVHKAMFKFEEGHPWHTALPRLQNDDEKNKNYLSQISGFGKGESKGTASVRFELLWRDYFRLCMLKFGSKVFSQSGYRGDSSYKWKMLSDPAVKEDFGRLQRGNTGMGLVDASMRELYLTGWTSNRARQNVASYLAKRMGIDWRLGAEWYECLLVDYDTSSNWGNWQYTAGVGNDPRGENRVFNQVKQAYDYDPEGRYIKRWVQELRGVDDVESVFQCWKLGMNERERVSGFSEDAKIAVEKPLVKIEYGSSRGGRGGKRGGHSGGGLGGGGRGNRGTNGGRQVKEKCDGGGGGIKSRGER